MRQRRKRSWRTTVRETNAKMTAPPDLINGRAMMAVSMLYESVTGKGLEHKESRGLPYLRTYLKDYKKYQDDVRRCLAGTYEVLAECHEERGETVDPKHIRLIKKTIKEEMEYMWGGKKRPKTEPDTPKAEEPAPEPKPEPEKAEVVEEEIDWETRFANGEFDLE